ncbi:MAG: hypothetical protein P857_800 [Candidatus Xenolissoclinum pacificiensis L6]|uniref:Outer membrane efflux family protein n=1 Tax=Candidatus Xenolissoclinum pacificiensis L6 TaxID=1401685 RepID=W2V0K2_9RICK|nr:MAG: hypothetical protein P857_800 [Candidatus Xenolissoclinum pacificiensis L6]
MYRIIVFFTVFLLSCQLQAVELSEALEKALENNPEIENARYEYRKSLLEPMQVISNTIPVLKFSTGNNIYSESNDFANPSSLNISVEHAPMRGAYEFTSYKRAKHAAQIAQTKFKNAVQEVSIKVVNTYFEMICIMNVKKELESYVNAFYYIYNNYCSEDNFKCNMFKYFFETHQDTIKNTLEKSRINYITLVNSAPDNLKLPKNHIPRIPDNMRSFVDSSIENSISILQKSQEQKDSYLGKQVAITKTMPSFNIYGAIYLNKGEYPLRYSEKYNYLGLVFSIPITPSGKNFTNIAKENFNYKQSIQNYRQSIKDVEQKMQNMFADYKSYKSQIKNTRHFSAFYKKTLDSAISTDSKNSTLDDINNYIDTFKKYQTALKNYYITLYTMAILTQGINALGVQEPSIII